MPFAFAERVAPPEKLTTVPTPWAVAGPLVTPQPHSVETASRAVKAGKESRHHHFYKKHMTMLGLRKELDSSDTDSETSENFQTKLFRRRHHPLKPVKSLAAREQEAIEAWRALRPWEQRVPPLDRIGLKPVMETDDDDRRRLADGIPRGKRVGGFGLPEEDDEDLADGVNGGRRKRKVPPPPPATNGGRLSRADEHRAAVSSGAVRTTLLNTWDERESALERARREFRASGPRPTPDMFRATPAPQQQHQQASPGPGRRSHSSMSGATAMSIARTVRALRKDHQESMHRHHLIMSRVAAPSGEEVGREAPPGGRRSVPVGGAFLSKRPRAGE